MNHERISLADTRSKKSRSLSYQTDEVSVASKHLKSSDTSITDLSQSLELKQVLYFVLVLGILIVSIAVSVFTLNNWNKSSSTGGNGSNSNVNTPSRSDIDETNLTWTNDYETNNGFGGILDTSPKSESSSSHDRWFLSDGLCQHENYLKTSLKNQYSANFGGIVMDLQNTYKYEASGVRYDTTRDKFFVVFDSLYGLGSIDLSLQRSNENIFIGDSNNGVIGESGFEGIAIDPENSDIYLVTEAVEYVDDLYRAIIHKISLEENGLYKRLSSCQVEYNFTSENKGLEGLSLLQDSVTGEKYFVGLCEGNYCHGGDKGKESGHGRLLLISYGSQTDGNGECRHSVIEKVHLGKEIDFTDYSAIAFRLIEGKENKYRTIVVSQEDSAIWVGEFDLNKREFSDGDDIYVFPKNLDCSTIYCNMEGIDWIDENTVVAVSDKTKSKGRQDFQCSLGDQSIFLFTIPP